MTDFHHEGRAAPTLDSDDLGPGRPGNPEPRLMAAQPGGYPAAWYRLSSAAAAGIPRPGVTARQRLACAQADYDRAAGALEQHAHRVLWDQLHEHAFAAGRALERAIRDAREENA